MDVGIHHPAVFPAAILLNERDGRIEVADGDQRFDAVLAALIEQRIVEGQPLFVGLCIVAVGQDAGPRDGQAVAPEAHLGEEGDVLLEVVVHVDGFVRGVVVLVIACQHLQLAEHHREAVLAKGNDIHIGQPAPAFVVGTSHWLAAVAPPHKKSFGNLPMKKYLLNKNSAAFILSCSGRHSRTKV